MADNISLNTKKRLVAEVNTFSFYKTNVTKSYANIPENFNEFRYHHWCMPVRMIIDPLIHSLKLIINATLFIPAVIESVLGLCGIKSADKKAALYALGLMMVNLVNIVAGLVVGLSRSFATLFGFEEAKEGLSSKASKVAVEALTMLSDTTDKTKDIEQDHMDNVLTLL